jgi:hypothetical protein
MDFSIHSRKQDSYIMQIHGDYEEVENCSYVTNQQANCNGVESVIEADSPSASQEFSAFLWNPNVHYRDCNGPRMLSVCIKFKSSLVAYVFVLLDLFSRCGFLVPN